MPLLAATSIPLPQLAAFNLAPTLVDASGQPRLTDERVGIGEARNATAAYFSSPSRNQIVDVRWNAGIRMSGDERDGVYVSMTTVLLRFHRGGNSDAPITHQVASERRSLVVMRSVGQHTKL